MAHSSAAFCVRVSSSFMEVMGDFGGKWGLMELLEKTKNHNRVF